MLFFNRIFASLFARQQKRERGIFVFWDGEKENRVDPMEAMRLLVDDPVFNIDTTTVLIDAGDIQAIGIGAAAVRRAFGVKLLSEGGLTETECIEVLADFIGFLARLKKNISPPPISASPTTSIPSVPDSITKPSADSGKTPSVPSSASLPA